MKENRNIEGKIEIHLRRVDWSTHSSWSDFNSLFTCSRHPTN